MTAMVKRPVGRAARCVTRLVAAAILVAIGPATLSAQATAAGGDSSVTAPATAPESDHLAFWSGLKFGATLEGYYALNTNRPPDRTTPLHAYDTRSDMFGLQQSALVFDSPVDVTNGRRFGLRLDLQFGQAIGTVQGNPVNEPRPDLYRNLWQAYGTYVFPVGRGLTLVEPPLPVKLAPSDQVALLIKPLNSKAAPEAIAVAV